MPIKAIPLPEQTGSMVGFFLSSRDALSLQPAGSDLPKGAVREEMAHLTLAFLGKSDDVAPFRTALIEEMRHFAEFSWPITGQITGIGVFQNQPDVDVVYAAFASDALAELRKNLLFHLETAGCPCASDYEFTPHITICYVPKGSDYSKIKVPPETFTFAAVTLTFGNEHHTYPMSGEAVVDALTDWQEMNAADSEAATAQQETVAAYDPPFTMKLGQGRADSLMSDDWKLGSAIEFAMRVISDVVTKSSPLDIWLGCSMNSFIDRNGIRTITPRKSIALDILWQHFCIKSRMPRADWEKPINGSWFEDYGALLTDHVWKQQFGRTNLRLMLAGGLSCFEIGWCLPGYSGSRSKMSIGFIPTYGSDGNVDLIHKYESSALKSGTEASAHTFFKASRSSLFKDGTLRTMLETFGKTLLPLGSVTE